MTPWWNPQQAGLIGGLAGATLGVLGGLFGTLTGVFAPRGKHKTFILAFAGALVAAGALTFLAGLAALCLRQPFAVWYPLLLLGGISTFVTAALVPTIQRRYRMADTRRLEAEDLRRG